MIDRFVNQVIKIAVACFSRAKLPERVSLHGNVSGSNGKHYVSSSWNKNNVKWPANSWNKKQTIC